MILLFTDFGWRGPYVGQMLTVLARQAPGIPVINLMADAPVHNPRAASYLLASLVPQIPAGTVVLGVVDPGVGTSEREPVLVEAAGLRFVGPGNALFGVAAYRLGGGAWNKISWRPPHLSASFHGRDLFAPVAAMLAKGESVETEPLPPPKPPVPDLAEVIYIDGFGNLVTGIRASAIGPQSGIVLNGERITAGETFGSVPPGRPLWYRNSMGLVEIAINRGHAAQAFGATIGTPVTLSR